MLNIPDQGSVASYSVWHASESTNCAVKPSFDRLVLYRLIIPMIGRRDHNIIQGRNVINGERYHMHRVNQIQIRTNQLNQCKCDSEQSRNNEEDFKTQSEKRRKKERRKKGRQKETSIKIYSDANFILFQNTTKQDFFRSI